MAMSDNQTEDKLLLKKHSIFDFYNYGVSLAGEKNSPLTPLPCLEITPELVEEVLGKAKSFVLGVAIAENIMISKMWESVMCKLVLLGFLMPQLLFFSNVERYNDLKILLWQGIKEMFSGSSQTNPEGIVH